MPEVAVMLFTRDLRVQDNPALVAAASAGPVVPLFVLDQTLMRSASIGRFRWGALRDALQSLDEHLRALGAPLVVRLGDPVVQTLEVCARAGANIVHIADDVTPRAHARLTALRRAAQFSHVSVVTHPGITHVPPGALTPAGATSYLRFTPYFRRWLQHASRDVLGPPQLRQAQIPDTFATGLLQAADALQVHAAAPSRGDGGEHRARKRAIAWIASAGSAGVSASGTLDGATSQLSPYLHLGCLSATELIAQAVAAGRNDTLEGFVRSLCWRDFNHQLVAADPRRTHRGLRDERTWRNDCEALLAWQRGQTGYPLIDAGMRQLVAEGWMPNRVRMVAASFLTKHLGIDWRLGARFYLQHLVDGDVANNAMQWQWAAGVGADSRPSRMFHPVTQAQRHDPAGAYVRRHVPELAHLDPPDLYRPWLAADGTYPPPMVEHGTARSDFLAHRTR